MVSKIEEYIKVVDSIYGIYLDSTLGFYSIRKFIIDNQKQVSNPEELDKLNFIYGKGDPREPNSRYLHVVTQGELKKRNEDEGENYRVIANMCVVLLYEYWESYYRNEIALELGLTSGNDLKSDIMGDLKELRHSIIHHRGYARKEDEKSKILKWFKEDELIKINKDQFEEIIISIKKYLYDLSADKK